SADPCGSRPDSVKRRKKFFIYLGIALLAAAAGWFAGGISFVKQIEQRTYDYRFSLKDIFPASTSAPITILAIDEKSLEGIPDPLMLWQRHFATVLNHIIPAGAAAVGVDVFFTPIERFDPDGETALTRALLSATEKDIPVPVVLAYRLRDDLRTDPPPPRLLASAGGIGYANLTVDS